MAAPFATTAGVPATIAQRFRGVAITKRAAGWAAQASKHTSLTGHSIASSGEMRGNDEVVEVVVIGRIERAGASDQP